MAFVRVVSILRGDAGGMRHSRLDPGSEFKGAHHPSPRPN
jgi:hypothetical protein